LDFGFIPIIFIFRVYRRKIIGTLKIVETPSKLMKQIKMTVQNTRAVDERVYGKIENFHICEGMEKFILVPYCCLNCS